LPIASIRVDLGLGYLLILPFWIAAISVITGRVLGVHVGRWRSALAAIIGWAVGLTAGVVALGPKNSHPLLIIPLSIFFGVLAALPVAIILDTITRSTRVRRRGRRTWLHPVRAVRSVLSPLGRFREVVGNARHENLLHVRYRTAAALASPDLARRLRLVLEKSGGMFVKFGQIAATRADLLPETLTTELSNLHSNVARVPPDQVQEVLVAELGEPVDKAFAQFETEPLAAASIGQTHRAQLHGGHRVVVKVQRPGLDDVVQRDAAVLSFVARQLDRRVESARRVGIRELADELIDSIEKELDYGRELEAGVRLREAAEEDGAVRIPEVHATLSSGRILVMDEVIGRSISDRAAVDAVPVPRPELARRLLGSFLSQILNDGYYHADPHPGNVLIDAEGTLWLLDFGAVGTLDPVTREALQGMAMGMTLRDGGILARSVRHLVGDDQIDMRQLERDLSMLLGEIQVGGLGPAAMMGVIEVMERHGLRPPRSMMLLSRTMITLEGTLRTLEPTFSLPAEATAVVKAEQGDEFGDIEEVLRKELIRVLPALRTLPEHAEAVGSQLRSGRMVVRTERYAGNDRAVVEDWFNRALVLAAGGVGAIAAGTVLVAGSLTSIVGVRDALWVLGFSGLTGSVILLMRAVAQALHAETARDPGSLGAPRGGAPPRSGPAPPSR
jgi:ubiquinone biosynthesis protein